MFLAVQTRGGLSRLGWEADPTVHKASLQTKENVLQITPCELFSGWDWTKLYFRWTICRKCVEYESFSIEMIKLLSKSSNASHTKVSYLISLFSSWWTTAPVGSATPYLSCLAPSVSRVTISSTPWSSPPKDPSTAPQTKTWTTYTSK